MKKKPINPYLVGAILLALVCIMLIFKHIKQKEEDFQQEKARIEEQAKKEQEAMEARLKELEAKKVGEIPKPPTKLIVYTKIPIQARDLVNETMLEMREVPLELVPQGAFENISDVVGKYTIRSLDAKEIATRSKIKPASEIGAMSFKVTPGMRAISIKVEADTSVGHLISNGDFVDLMLTEKEPGGNKPIRTRIILQNIKVLSFFKSEENEQTAGIPKTADQTVTIEVVPEQAEGLMQITGMGTLSMILRNIKDRSTVRTLGFTREEIVDDLGVIQGRAQRTLKAISKTQDEGSLEVKNGQ